jgi:hypothetical protein
MDSLQPHYGLSTDSLQTLCRLSADSLQTLYRLSTVSLDSLQTLCRLYRLSTDSLQPPMDWLQLSMALSMAHTAAVLLQCCAEHRGCYRHYSTAGTAAALLQHPEFADVLGVGRLVLYLCIFISAIVTPSTA